MDAARSDVAGSPGPWHALAEASSPVVGRIDLWLTSVSAPGERLLDCYRALLPERERNEEHRFRFERDRRRYVVTRAMVRTVLSRYARRSPESWRFELNAYGRPAVANRGEIEERLSFNLSHASDVIFLAVTARQAIGVDVEAVDGLRGDPDVATRFFAPSEVAALRATPQARQVSRFFEYWTLKESYIKARGMGLTIPLDSFAFDLDQGSTIRFSVAAGSDRASRWSFWQLRPAAHYLAALCVERVGAISPVLICHTVVPLRSSAPIPCEVIRKS